AVEGDQGAEPLMPTFRVPLPPSANHGYAIAARFSRKRGWHARMMKTEVLEEWEGKVGEIVGGWVPPKRARLAVQITLALPRAMLRRRDMDGPVKYLIDATVGRRCDQWIDRLEVVKTVGDGWAEVNVETI
ncbi:MAG: hypothetical protein V2A73_00355, partial [Pseudomonadota bacterium]